MRCKHSNDKHPSYMGQSDWSIWCRVRGSGGAE